MDTRDQIVKQIQEMMLKAKAGAWQKPFQNLNGRPFNVVTDKPYQGLNAFFLSLLGQTHWAGFKQWKEVGATVKRGEKSTKVALPIFKKDKESGELVFIGKFRPVSIFHSGQVEGWEAPKSEENDTPLFERLENVEKFIDNLKALDENPLIENITLSDRAFYSPLTDETTNPAPECFRDTETSTAQESFYSTRLHEIGHWTGAPHRLDRTKGARFGDDNYAFEELCAETVSCLLCCQLGITSTPREDHAQYLAGWAKATTKEFVEVVKLAYEAVDYLNGLQSKAVNKAA